MWLKLTTDSDLVSQPSGYINTDTSRSADVRFNDGVAVPYYAIEFDSNQIDTGTRYTTPDAAQAALADLIATL
jgi:hypothetical protein